MDPTITEKDCSFQLDIRVNTGISPPSHFASINQNLMYSKLKFFFSFFKLDYSMKYFLQCGNVLFIDFVIHGSYNNSINSHISNNKNSLICIIVCKINRRKKCAK